MSRATKWSNLTEKDLAEVKHTAQATIQTYKAEIDSQLKNIDVLANAYLMTNEDSDESVITSFPFNIYISSISLTLLSIVKLFGIYTFCSFSCSSK